MSSSAVVEGRATTAHQATHMAEQEMQKLRSAAARPQAWIQSSKHSGNNVICPRSWPSTKRFIRSPLANHCRCRRFYTAKVIKRLADRASRSAGLHPEPDNAAAGGGGVTRGGVIGSRLGMTRARRTPATNRRFRDLISFVMMLRRRRSADEKL